MDLQEIERSLRKRLADLEHRLSRIKSDVTQGHSSDSAEQAQERENDEVVDAIGEETRVAIAATKGALGRLADGSYGECECCGEAIAPARLLAMPEATRCINCAE
jgi:RNA polymerase-binding transcription factor DksA